MKYFLTQEQKEELEKIGALYRKTIYDSSIVYLPDIVKAFGNGLQEINGNISLSISGEVLRFHKLISSRYVSQMLKRIDGLYNILFKDLPTNILFTITCRQKSWDSVLKKILKYYFEGDSIILYDLVALRITVDSIISEEEQKVICHKISELCIEFFMQKQKCRLLSPSKRVANNPLLKDYIDYPKDNGYQSIHLAFMDICNNIFEIQIRTQLMDANAEYGLENEIEKDLDHEIEKDLDHGSYKDNEYSEIIPYIYFDITKVNKPLFRTYQRINPYTKKPEDILVDKIGLKYAKKIEERARTF